MPSRAVLAIKAAAREAGEKYFFTGEPCKRGHIAKRFLATGKCMECNRENAAALRATPEGTLRNRQVTREWARNNPERHQENLRSWRKANRERHNESNKRWTERHPEQARAIARSNTAVRMRRLRERIPAWASRRSLRDVYRECPEGLVVDHFVPIAGKTACGLHVPENLQYLTPAENSEKSNEWDWETQNARWERPTRFWANFQL